jgi:hypothetical protein
MPYLPMHRPSREQPRNILRWKEAAFQAILICFRLRAIMLRFRFEPVPIRPSPRHVLEYYVK